MNEHPMSIEIRALEAEIERLKAHIEATRTLEIFQDHQAEIQKKDAEIERLKETTTHLQRECLKRGQRIADLERLIIRAADALEKYTSYPIGMAMSVTLRESGRSILAELRKAAE